MRRPFQTLPALLLAASFAAFGCHAQNPPAGATVSAELSRRIEVLLRTKAQLPPASTIQVSERKSSELPGYDLVSVTFTNEEGTRSRPIEFLLSKDGKTLAQFNKYDISANPRTLLSTEDRPARGGTPDAPVLIVGFDDLECPYCARLHASIFPAIAERYKDQVRVVYRDFPLTEIHPWAMRAAVDVNCVAAVSPAGYWNLVDYIHAHAGEFGKPDEKTAAADKAAADKAPQQDKTLDRANQQLDKLAHDQVVFQKADVKAVDACVTKQDTTAVQASRKLAQTLSLDSAPYLFINGDRVEGAVPIEFIFKIIDNALVAEGKTPPPPFVSPKAPAPATPAAPPKPAGGN